MRHPSTASSLADRRLRIPPTGVPTDLRTSRPPQRLQQHPERHVRRRRFDGRSRLVGGRLFNQHPEIGDALSASRVSTRPSATSRHRSAQVRLDVRDLPSDRPPPSLAGCARSRWSTSSSIRPPASTHLFVTASSMTSPMTGKAREAAQLLAIRCEHRGCDVPAAFCDIDHIDEHTTRNGETNQANALPLCGVHNRWTVP